MAGKRGSQTIYSKCPFSKIASSSTATIMNLKHLDSVGVLHR